METTAYVNREDHILFYAMNYRLFFFLPSRFLMPLFFFESYIVVERGVVRLERMFFIAFAFSPLRLPVL